MLCVVDAVACWWCLLLGGVSVCWLLVFVCSFVSCGLVMFVGVVL